jgi:hypothetical protein
LSLGPTPGGEEAEAPIASSDLFSIFGDRVGRDKKGKPVREVAEKSQKKS